jgi:hypothetical protein
VSKYEVVKFAGGKYGVTDGTSPFVFFGPPTLPERLFGMGGFWWAGPQLVARYCLMSERSATKWCKKLNQKDRDEDLERAKVIADVQVAEVIECSV